MVTAVVEGHSVQQQTPPATWHTAADAACHSSALAASLRPQAIGIPLDPAGLHMTNTRPIQLTVAAPSCMTERMESARALFEAAEAAPVGVRKTCGGMAAAGGDDVLHCQRHVHAGRGGRQSLWIRRH